MQNPPAGARTKTRPSSNAPGVNKPTSGKIGQNGTRQATRFIIRLLRRTLPAALTVGWRFPQDPGKIGRFRLQTVIEYLDESFPQRFGWLCTPSSGTRPPHFSACWLRLSQLGPLAGSFQGGRLV